jgi:NAD(P)-dependent dehydrogenase (short-subunit alcohol dehydrogenase family)
VNRLLDFTGKTVLITGAASGFGALLARTMYQKGVNLALGDCNFDALKQLTTDLDSSGKRIVIASADVTKESDCKSLVDAAVSAYGRLDIAVNNAGVAQSMTSFHEQDEAEFDRQFAINTKGVFFGMKHQIIQMLNQDAGTILNVSSMAGLGAAPKLAAYSAAKHAVIGLTKTAAVEYARRNIRINAICPFFSPTPLMSNNAGMESPEKQEFLAKGSPMKRLAEPQEVVNAMILACAPSNTYMTGQTIAIDGGISAF